MATRFSLAPAGGKIGPVPGDFYNAFDRTCLEDVHNRPRQSDYRSVFHQDRDRVMFTSSFRRLQAKTQVFQVGEYDFYRTRLTHSLEVANIAKSIAVWLRQEHPEVVIDPDLLEATCLAHDIGHPPFGHAGERALNRLMVRYGGFEGNAQTLRILTRTIYSQAEERGGMSPSRALLDGVLKYKRLFSAGEDKTHHFIFDDQAEVLAFCLPTEDLDLAIGTTPRNRFRSLECQVMNLADDIAYSCFDLVDGAKARFLTPASIHAWREEHPTTVPEEASLLEELLAIFRDNRLEPRMNRIIGELIQGATLVPQSNFMSERTHRYSWRLQLGERAAARIKLHKALARDLVFGSSALQQIEAKGGWILERLAGCYFQNYGIPLEQTIPSSAQEPQRVGRLKLVPDSVHRRVVQTDDLPGRARLLCDHLSGMTDAYALRSYKRLYDPNYGSISELV